MKRAMVANSHRLQNQIAEKAAARFVAHGHALIGIESIVFFPMIHFLLHRSP